MKYRVPHGHVLVRPDPIHTRTLGGIEIATVSQEQPPSGVVVEVADPFQTAGLGARLPAPPVYAHVGDRVHHKKYAGVDIELLMDDAPPVVRCVNCNARQDHPDLLPMCPKRLDAAHGDPQPHEWGDGVQEPEGLLVLDLRDVVLVIPGDSNQVHVSEVERSIRELQVERSIRELQAGALE